MIVLELSGFYKTKACFEKLVNNKKTFSEEDKPEKEAEGSLFFVVCLRLKVRDSTGISQTLFVVS